MRPTWFRRILSVGDSGPDVRIVRRKLGLDPDGGYDRLLAERVRGLAKKAGIKSNGEVTEDVAGVLGEAADAGLNPEWYHRDLQLWFEGDDVRAVRGILGLGSADNRYDPDCESAVRRFQSENGIVPDGLVTAELARRLGPA